MDPAQTAEEAHREAKQKAIIEALLRGDSDVVTLYDGATVFVTGGTGFLGKQLVEKLLRACKISKIYFLVRSKKEKTPETRLKEVLEDPVYDVLRKGQPNFQNKIIPIEGDVGERNIGLSQENWQRISEEVNVIFHLAATVNFQEEIRKATLINVRGTREILRLAKQCSQLKSLVHVSTAFAHATKSRIKKTVDEDFYPVPATPDYMIKLAEDNQIDLLNEIFAREGADWPNTYSFTKAIAEEAVRLMGNELPVCIVRPGIGISAYREPNPGWVDPKNALGASGIVLGTLIGIIHVLLADVAIRMDFIPIDVVSNAIIAAGWETAKGNIDKTIKIYTVTNTRKPTTFGVLEIELNTIGRVFMSPHTVWYSFTVVTRSKLLYMTLHWFLHYIPACIIDSALYILGQKPRLLKVYRKVSSLSMALYYFMNNDWIFRDDNTLNLYMKLSSTDKHLFNFDMADVDPKKAIEVWVLGMRRYIIKDGLEGTIYARKRQHWLHVLHYFVLVLYVYGLYKLFYAVLSSVAFIYGSIVGN